MYLKDTPDSDVEYGGFLDERNPRVVAIRFS